MPTPSLTDQYQSERDELIEAFKENDLALYERYSISCLFLCHSAALDLALNNQLAKAARLRFEADWDEAKVAAANLYTTMYLIAGLTNEDARQQAEDLAENVSGSGGLAGLAALL